MARDIAFGCRYLEENHFIHRFAAFLIDLVFHVVSSFRLLFFLCQLTEELEMKWEKLDLKAVFVGC